ncbi:uncharacterized protein LOC120917583 [Rana temporaria]|uniref:uncharacterized protein LOC120917583 n=1 Tax=Rana temporaria TaxID=8407 RepID=UPI001AACE66F|nr:uncharacterized protein LOC120917583 [Rana temporaria]
MFWHPECDCPDCDMEDPITPSCDWLYRAVSAEDDERPASISRTEERNTSSRMTPHHPGHHGSERAWLSRWLELSTQRLRELHVMRQEAEDRVRGVLEDEHWTTWRRNTEDSMGRTRTKPRRNQNQELGHIQEEEIGGAIGRAFTPQKGNGDPQHSQGPALTQELLHRMSLRGPPENWNHPMGPGHDSLTMGDGAQSTEPYMLRRIGSGSLAPRLRLGSSGVTSDLLFTRRFSGNCLSTHSSGFYENSDLDSISSSCSSLCSDSSCHTSFSMMSPHRSSEMRPRSIDYTNERRKELQNGRAQQRRPISAGALEGLSLSSISSSRYDITQYNDRTTCDHTYPSTPPLCAIQQRRKAQRYICKLALKYRCKPGVTNPLPDLGPPTPRTPVSASHYSERYNSCPPSPQINSLSSSLGDVRKTPKGSWGRFFSRVMLKKDSRIAASELNLQHCINNPQSSPRSPSHADGHLVRAKSFRDLLSVNPFKRSQRGLNKMW